MEEHHQSNDYAPLQNGNKEQKYKNVIQHFEERLDSASHPLSNTSNLIALLRQEFNWWWIGYYWLNQQNNQQCLGLGQFQGPVACTKLFKGKGVCGTAWLNQKTIILQDVNTFQGHIACSSISKSEIVIPIYSDKVFVGVLDIDSKNYSDFDEVDQKYLKVLLDMIEQIKHFEWFAKNL